jgi:hypothetical protein
MNASKKSYEFRDQAEAFFAPVAKVILMLQKSYDQATGKVTTQGQASQKDHDNRNLRGALNSIHYTTDEISHDMYVASLNFQQPGGITGTKTLRFEKKRSPKNNENRDLFLADVVTKTVQAQTLVDPKAGNGFRLAQQYGEAVRKIIYPDQSEKSDAHLNPASP